MKKPLKISILAIIILLSVFYIFTNKDLIKTFLINDRISFVSNQEKACDYFIQNNSPEPTTNEGDILLPLECSFAVSKEHKYNFILDNKDKENFSLNIFDQNGEYIQEIVFDNNIFNKKSVYMDDSDFNIAHDINSDGYKDIRVFSGGGTSDWWFDFYLFNPKENNFILLEDLSKIGNSFFDEKQKAIIGYSRNGSDKYTDIFLKFKEGSEILQEKNITEVSQSEINENISIEIKQENNNLIKISGSIEQEIDFDKDMLLYEGLDHDGMSSIDFEDHNKDGYKDMLIMRDTSGSLVTSYAVYLYDKNFNKFVFTYFLIRSDGEEEKINYSNKESFYFSEIKKDMSNSEIKVPILLPQKMKIETDGEKIVADYQVIENGGYKVHISIFVPGEYGCSAEYCTVGYFGAAKYDDEGIVGGFGWEKTKITEELEGYYFNNAPRVMPSFEFVYKDILYFVQIKNKSKEEIIAIVKDMLFMDNN